ncbi:putative T7SS-secreted protein [Streptomyces sp. Z26]|uniref:putative T7SS-secreted protein n=1 Tax=Streptomyces sp. Z26 TaxID=2500177 RepID=UPI000EF130DD|nr:HNH/endonuclease VII fold putative polymorphic toxin [Streptomyces sp. Z26]RLL66500.1 type IV secretion protein Rhs [Streptomyces sp. Z26]
MSWGPVDDWVDKGKEFAGEVIDEGGELAADGLEGVGWQDGADAVRHAKNAAANRLGADVAELSLGQTDDPKELVFGSAGKLRSTGRHLADFQRAFDKVGNGLKGLDPGHWKGEAAEAFRDRLDPEPKKWFEAADACEKAAEALEDFAGTVDWAQGRAREALAKWKAAATASEDAEKAHHAKVDTYNSAADAYNAAVRAGDEPGTRPKPPGEFRDPGPKLREEAQEILAAARGQRDEAAERARSAVRAAKSAAPAKPSAARRFASDAEINALDVTHLAGGAIKGSAGVLAFARSVNPMDPHNLMNPADYVTNLNSAANGMYQMARDPQGTAENMAKAFQGDPADFLGQLAPELVGTKGAGLLKTGSRAGRLGLRKHPDGPDGSGRAPESVSNGPSDPVDMATGRMYLPQTDVTLPGALPLVFVRRVESGYAAGRSFGPSWSSTADQRLEVDAEGVVFVTEDGRLLAYPHPAPGVPVLPSAGARWPLDRTPDGGYTVTDHDAGLVRHFGPPGDGRDGVAPLEEISDRNGHTITFEYDADGTPSALVHSGGYRLDLAVTDGRITALSLDGRELVRYGYTGADLTSVTGSSGLPLRFAYDDEHRVISWTDTNDRRYDYVYDHRDRCVAEGGTDGHVQLRLAYDDTDPETGHRVTTVTTSRGHVYRYVVNDRCQIVAETDPLGAVTRTEWDPYHRVLSRTDPLGRTVRLGYDGPGTRPVTLTRPDGRATSATYNDLRLPVTTTAADGTTWRYTYDDRGNRTSATDPLGHRTAYAYDPRGHLTAVTDALGGTTRVRCDAAGLPVEITDPLGAVTTYERDAFGRPVALVDPLGAVTRLEWSVEGRLLSRTEPDGARQRWTYDGEGNRTAHVDANGGVSTYEYTHFDLLTAQTGPDGVRYEFAHDSELRLTRVTDPQGLVWSYAYDPAGRLTSETDFDGRTLTYAYDAAGQLATRTGPSGDTVAYTHDELGRIVRKEADGDVTTFAYDAAGRLLEATGPGTQLVWQRDKLGRARTEFADGRVLTHTYDALGRRTRRVTPSGAVSTFTYDLAGNRTSVTASGHTLDFTHDAAGRETGRRMGDTLTQTQLWDPAGRLTDVTVLGPGSRPVRHRSYAYRADGNLTSVTDDPSGARHFDLDATGRVTGVRAEGWTETYAYDDAGNQTHADWPGGHALPEARGTRTYTGTRVETAGRVRYEHDAAGRVTLRRRTRLSRKPDTWHYTWNADDRLTGVTTPDGTAWRYTYDVLGRRTSKARLGADGETVERVDFTWDGPVLIEQTTTAPDLPHPVTLTWDHDGFTPLTQTERLTDAATQAEIDARFFAIVTDLVGTPTELVDERGGIAWRTRSTLWGHTTWNADATAYTPLRFPGQYHDPETGLHYNLHRHYDPTTARYTTPDPLGLTPSPNPTTYVPNPHTWTDPLGLAPGCGDVPTHKHLASRSEAFREAKRDLGIPSTQHPDEVTRVAMSDKFGTRIVDERGIPIVSREYVFTRADGGKVIIQDHSAGHQFGEGGVGDQGRHFNVRPYDNPRTGKLPGTSQHYEY